MLNTPTLYLNRQRLDFVKNYKHLGTIIAQDASDDENMSRLRGPCYARST